MHATSSYIGWRTLIAMAARRPTQARKKAVAAELPTGPRPWRLEPWGIAHSVKVQGEHPTVETVSTRHEFGWRVVANDGTLISEEGGFEDPIDALRAGQQRPEAEGAVIQLPPSR